MAKATQNNLIKAPRRLEVVIGLEVHAQVNSRAKLFSGASTAFAARPTRTCRWSTPPCRHASGHQPECVAQAVRTGLARGEINHRSTFDRKNYFYPDLPQGYQISQYKNRSSAKARFRSI